MNRPDLYVFAISHYCEKARWALDALGITYTLRHLAPAAHFAKLESLGAPATSLPALVSGGVVVQGSDALFDWADATTKSAARLAPDAVHAEGCLALEKRLDEAAGVHVRRYYYSEALVEHSRTVLPIFADDLEAGDRAWLEENWDNVHPLMAARMDLGREQWNESRAIVTRELDFVDGLLADGRRYLVGDRFSRADITAASLLAPLARPKEHPTYGRLQVPPRVAADIECWSDRPVTHWVAEMYREHRGG